MRQFKTRIKKCPPDKEVSNLGKHSFMGIKDTEVRLHLVRK